MKKSEMIEIIKDELDHWQDSQLDETTAKCILNTLISYGMMPPWSENDKVCMCSMRGTCPGCSPQLFESEWEKE